MAIVTDNSGVEDWIRKGWRVVWTIASGLAVESVVFGLSVLPAALSWMWVWRLGVGSEWIRLVMLSGALIPAYVVFALCLIVFSAASMRLLGWRTPANAEMRIADLPPALLVWGRYLASAHVVRVFAGTLFRATPFWTWYHRLNGARIGRRVYINSLAVMDDNLLEFADGVIIGAGAHLSGHTVEGGIVKTAPVRLGRNVTIGVGSVIGIGVDVGADTEVGALSLVPKHRRLEPSAVYGGVPVRRIDADASSR